MRAIETAKNELSTLANTYLSDIPDMDEAVRSKARWDELWWVYVLPFPIFLAAMLITANILRAMHVNPTKFGWHSRKARTIAAQIAALEPSDSPGLFADEVRRIHDATFPADVWLGRRFLRQTRRVIEERHAISEESESILALRESLDVMTGKIIPHGNEDVLGIVCELSRRADECAHEHRKGAKTFVQARDILLGVHGEMKLLGDVLGVWGNSLDHYKLLGLQPRADLTDVEVKDAHRKVIAIVHPDRNPDNAAAVALAQLINDAYRLLKTADRRAGYVPS